MILFRCSTTGLLDTGCKGNYLIVSFDSRPRQNAVQFIMVFLPLLLEKEKKKQNFLALF